MKLVTIYGGSGFVGRYIAQRFAKAGWRVRVAVRRPNEALFVRPYGAPGQVEPILCNIRDESSTRAAMKGADAVINCVGLLNPLGKNRFDAVHVEGAGRIAALARKEKVGHLVHISALGADAEGPSAYLRSKGEGEAAVRAAFPGAVILRPSIIFGAEDGFFNRFAAMARLMPVLAITGGATQFQPVYVGDVAEAAFRAVEPGAAPGVYALAGPEVATFKNWLQRMLPMIRRRRLVLSMPFWLARIPAFGFDALQALTLGLFENRVLTGDQVKSLKVDSVAPEGLPGLAAFGITPTAAEAVLPEYLWRYRPTGQFEAIKESAKNLKKA